MTAFTSKRIGVTAAALLLAATLVGANAAAANASYINAPSLSVNETHITPTSDPLYVNVNNAPENFTVTWNGGTKTTASEMWTHPSKAGVYALQLHVGGKVVSQIDITEGSKITAISLNKGTITHGKSFTVTGSVSPATAGAFTVTLLGRTTGGFDVMSHSTSSSTGSYALTGKFLHKGVHYLRVQITANAYASAGYKTVEVTVK